jgi:hypothetical protein
MNVTATEALAAIEGAIPGSYTAVPVGTDQLTLEAFLPYARGIIAAANVQGFTVTEHWDSDSTGLIDKVTVQIPFKD